MRCISIRRAATLYQVVAFALAFSLSAIDAAGHTHDATSAARRLADKPSGATVSIEERLGELHSAVVHFPIAMLLSAALSEALLAATGRESFRYVTRFVIWIGALGALSAAPLGWFAARTLEDAPATLVAWHRWLGVSTALWSLVTLWASEYATDARSLLRWLIACATLLVVATGYLGGELVHDTHTWEEGVR